jgi:hypothetical protein
MRPIWDARIKLLPVATFFKSSVIDAPVSRVFGFHEREDALALLTRLGLLRARCNNPKLTHGAQLQYGPGTWVTFWPGDMGDTLLMMDGSGRP